MAKFNGKIQAEIPKNLEKFLNYSVPPKVSRTDLVTFAKLRREFRKIR